ncbi:MAG: radical SAM protein [Dehalococcoidia bacterium]
MPAATGSPQKQGKVLLINLNQMMPPVSPLALDYLAHALSENQYQVDILDLCFTTDIQRAVKQHTARGRLLAVAISLRNTDDVYLASQDFFVPKYKELIDLLKTQTDAPIILGGSGFSTMPQAILSYCELDLGIWGEGEFSLPLLIGRIAANEDYRDVPGLVYRSRGKFHANPATYLDLSRISAPARGAIDNQRYFVEGGVGSIETKRGCPMGCIYCADPLGKGRRLRLRSPQSVAREVRSLLEMGIDHFHLCDSEFNIPKDHALEICTELAAEGLGDKIRWYTYASPAGFTKELAALCRKAGCVGINFGVDSGCDRMLRRLGRDFTVEDITRTAEACRQEGIISMYDLLLGGPGETRQSLRETIETMKRLSPNRVGTSLGVRVFPKTKLALSLRRQGALNENPNLHGTVAGNDHFFAPIFYLSSRLGDDASDYLSHLIGEDERFFFVSPADAEKNYNYNDNTVLVNAIKAGYRGAFWDILRRLSEKS